MFDLSKPYVTLKEPGDTGRNLMIQGSIALWEGLPPTDFFPTPGWAQKPSGNVQDTVNFAERTDAVASKIVKMKGKLKAAQAEVTDAENSET